MQNWNLQRAFAPHRSNSLSAAKSFNTWLDKRFYDVGALSEEEIKNLTQTTTSEGHILVVHPGDRNQPINSYPIAEYVELQTTGELEFIDSVVVPGVGSSDLGAAAFARNVADYLGRPVAAAVAGYGLADMVTEALGGWYILGARNHIRYSYARLFDMMEMKDHVWDDTTYSTRIKTMNLPKVDLNQFIFGSPDSLAVLVLLSHFPNKIKLLVGHSKGNYSIENALEGFADFAKNNQIEIPKDLQIVTLGATIYFPNAFTNVHQFIGRWDTFGRLNSRPLSEGVTILAQKHTLNSEDCGHLPVKAALAAARIQ